MSGNKDKKKDPLICVCNGVRRSRIEEAIERGCDSLGKIFDATMAGVGPCGGSCRADLRKILEEKKAEKPPSQK